ncbi:unnamed protein product [Aureobasidium vineae]|uniref:Uncharacterized protein n=1 Tax=Aureobasidium vineae TaxID=2773715 RepID=A0A9N8JF28_9PEZI|nr:unnamed protein product [Aureobasidium vineae]
MLEPSRVAEETGYERPDKQQRALAAGFADTSAFEDNDFPGPLVLPNDAIDSDPKYPLQSFADWKKLITPTAAPLQRKKIYIAAPPGRTKHCPRLYEMQWPHKDHSPPQSVHVLGYLAAFYTGFEVVELPENTLIFDKWTEGAASSPSDSSVALNTPKESVRIRKRPMPKNGRGFQLNLNVMLDAAIAVLPSDALALILLMDFDMYEDNDDEFGCGRAYGGSHVCIVSSFRYNPSLDRSLELDRDHLWPASHCAKYVQEQVDKFIEPAEADQESKATKSLQHSVPLARAIRAHPSGKSSSYDMWLERICRTASHELGHCLGMDYCMYYACIMQGSNSIAEDLGQPPYPCPIDNAKLYALIEMRGDAAKVGIHRHRVGEGPEAILAKLQPALAERSISHRVAIIDKVDDFEGEIGRSFAVLRQIAVQTKMAVTKNEFPIILAGNCSSSAAVLAGLNAAGLDQEDLDVFWPDAHADTHVPDDPGIGYFDSMGIAMLTGLCWKGHMNDIEGHNPFHFSRLHLLGIRSYEAEEMTRLHDHDASILFLRRRTRV